MPPESRAPAVLTRRHALAALAGGFGAVLAARPALAAGADPAAAPPTRRLLLKNVHTLESLEVEYCRAGAYCAAGLAQVNQLLRDHRNGAVHAIDPGVLDLLHATAQRCGRDPEFEVISGYRSPASNALMHARSSGVAEHSLHVEGRAIDVRLRGCDLRQLHSAGLALARGGVGYYPALDFVHLDTGRVRAWAG
jgi:uncharacterized protein YcbK (DUF882 family)